MEKNNKIFRIFIPVIAVIIIFESVMLVSGLEKNEVVNEKKVVTTEVKKDKVAEKNTFDLVFVTDSEEMKVDKTYKVELQGLVKEKSTLDAIDIAIKYDANSLDISELIFDKNLQKPIVGKAIKEDGMIVVKYLIEAKKGMTFNVKDIISLVSFNIKAKKIGSYELEVATGNEDKKFVTMFIENTSAKALPFTSNKLEIKVIK